MDRFKMNFGNLNNQKLIHQLMSNQKSHQPSYSSKLNSSMIDRVHKARQGCSACGKKVM
jgi:hypothetical protein